MDLISLKSSKADSGSVLELKHPSTLEVLEGVTITLLGSDSKKAQSLKLAKQQSALDRINKGRNALKLEAKKLSDDSISEAAALTVAWKGIELAGEALECNEENAKRIYTELPWVLEQVNEFIAERANFF